MPVNLVYSIHFLGYSRSLVSTQAGTTRDYIEERLFIVDFQ